MTRVQAKICGLNDAVSVKAAVDGKADYIGMVFFAKSPRAVTPAQAAMLTEHVPDTVKIVGLFVDPDDDLIRDVLAVARLDLIQLHGSESVERVLEIKKAFNIPVMKALKIAEKIDIENANSYVGAADMLLFDAKAPKSMENALPGGNGLVFDWRMLANVTPSLPWMLAGGLDAANVLEAVTISGAPCVDTSSGVEVKPGVKDPAAIARFLEAVRTI
ncbi:MAG: phosphoribosylanthranilate isomerase [Sneathiella sp.]|nr:phosphoribosylanthranilate isomerase [Sneathiella sp.]